MLPTAPLSLFWLAAVEFEPAVEVVALRDADVVAVPVPVALVPVAVALVVDPVVVVELPRSVIHQRIYSSITVRIVLSQKEEKN
ncbi:hypothetical protein NMY22_g18839 [Coprinellus aureogranulatus]|nr:hypothetical protein NMY22_g18839 [Coprinellus aureogranulatus]